VILITKGFLIPLTFMFSFRGLKDSNVITYIEIKTEKSEINTDL